MAGTLLGGAAAVLFVPTFINAPLVLTAVLGLWLGFCLFMGLLDRTPRGYAFLLAGYTACIIGFPAVTDPGNIFTIAAARVQEITLGIVCASLVHTFLLPRSVSEQFLARVDAALADARVWTDRAMAPLEDRTIESEQRRLASDIADLHQMSIHLPFDTTRVLPRTRTVRALLDQLTMLLPLITTIEDRLTALRSGPGGCPAAVEAMIERLLGEREAEKQEIEARLATTPVAKPAAAIPSAPILLKQFEAKVANLYTSLDVEESRTEAAGIIGRLIDRVTIHPHGEHGPEAEVEASAGVLLRFATTENPRRPFEGGGGSTTVVAGTGSVQNLRDPQVEVVAGGRNHQNLRTQKSRPIGAADVRDLVSQVEMVAGARNHLNLLFGSAA